MASGPAEARPNSTAEHTSAEWQRRIEAQFLHSHGPGEPFVLFLDDDEARRLWPELGDPVASLSAAVSGTLAFSSGSGLFRPLADAARTQGIRSALPLLALTVVAGTRMQKDKSHGSTAYFARLARLLRPDAPDGQIQALRDQISQGFGDVAAMWKSLDAWLDEHADQYGPSTVRDHPTLTRIGYPLSQALIRTSDRMRLTNFFAALDVTRRGVPEKGPLQTYLQLWTERPRGLTGQFVAAIRDPDLADLVIDQVHRFATAWDGNVRNPEGRRRLDLRLVFDLDTFGTRWAAPVLDGISADTLNIAGGGTLEIRASEHGSLYQLSGLPVPSEGTAKKISAIGAHCSVAFELPALFAAREHAGAGGWMSVDTMLPYEEHLLVVPPEHRAEVEKVLEAAARAGWRVIDQKPPRTLLPGRVIFRRVTLADPAAFEQVAAKTNEALARTLRPDVAPRPQLVNGLRIATNLGSRHYLAGGEPDLLLPVGTSPRHVAAALDGTAQKAPGLKATGFPLDLRRFHLPAGPHQLSADGETLTFHVLDGLQSGPPEAGLGWADEGEALRLGELPGSAAQISGASVPGSGPRPRLLRRGGDYFLVNHAGLAAPLAPPTAGAWLARRGLGNSQYWDFVPPPDGVWLFERRRGQLLQPSLLRWHEPHVRHLDPASAGLWSAARDRWQGAQGLLDIYLNAARPK